MYESYCVNVPVPVCVPLPQNDLFGIMFLIYTFLKLSRSLLKNRAGARARLRLVMSQLL